MMPQSAVAAAGPASKWMRNTRGASSPHEDARSVSPRSSRVRSTERSNSFAIRDHDGKVYRAGEELVYAPGSSHFLTVDGDEDVIFVARAFDGIELQLPAQS